MRNVLRAVLLASSFAIAPLAQAAPQAIAPILATAVAYVVFRYGARLAHEVKIRRALMTLLLVGFCSAMVAGTVGALIAKMAPNAFLYQ